MSLRVLQLFLHLGQHARDLATVIEKKETPCPVKGPGLPQDRQRHGAVVLVCLRCVAHHRVRIVKKTERRRIEGSSRLPAPHSPPPRASGRGQPRVAPSPREGARRRVRSRGRPRARPLLRPDGRSAERDHRAAGETRRAAPWASRGAVPPRPFASRKRRRASSGFPCSSAQRANRGAIPRSLWYVTREPSTRPASSYCPSSKRFSPSRPRAATEVESSATSARETSSASANRCCESRLDASTPNAPPFRPVRSANECRAFVFGLDQVAVVRGLSRALQIESGELGEVARAPRVANHPGLIELDVAVADLRFTRHRALAASGTLHRARERHRGKPSRNSHDHPVTYRCWLFSFDLLYGRHRPPTSERPACEPPVQFGAPR